MVSSILVLAFSNLASGFYWAFMMGSSLLNKTIFRMHNMVSRDYWIRALQSSHHFLSCFHPAGEISMTTMQPSFLLPIQSGPCIQTSDPSFQLFLAFFIFLSFHFHHQHDTQGRILSGLNKWRKVLLDQSSGLGTPAVQWTSQANY